MIKGIGGTHIPYGLGYGQTPSGKGTPPERQQCLSFFSQNRIGEGTLGSGRGWRPSQGNVTRAFSEKPLNALRPNREKPPHNS